MENGDIRLIIQLVGWFIFRVLGWLVDQHVVSVVAHTTTADCNGIRFQSYSSIKGRYRCIFPHTVSIKLEHRGKIYGFVNHTLFGLTLVDLSLMF